MKTKNEDAGVSRRNENEKDFDINTVTEYFKCINVRNAAQEAIAFWNYNQMMGWKVGRSKVKSFNQMRAIAERWKYNLTIHPEYAVRLMPQSVSATPPSDTFDLSPMEFKRLCELAEQGSSEAVRMLRRYYESHPDKLRSAERFFAERPEHRPSYWSKMRESDSGVS